MSEIKKASKKLHGGPIIEVDTQILRWRQRMAKEGVKLGRATRYREKVNKKQNEERAEFRAKRDDIRKKKFF